MKLNYTLNEANSNIVAVTLDEMCALIKSSIFLPVIKEKEKEANTETCENLIQALNIEREEMDELILEERIKEMLMVNGNYV